MGEAAISLLQARVTVPPAAFSFKIAHFIDLTFDISLTSTATTTSPTAKHHHHQQLHQQTTTMAMSQSPAALSAKGDELRLDVESSYVLVPTSAGDDGSAVDTQHYQQDDQLENIPRDDGDDDVASSCCPSYVASDDEDYDDADLPGAMPWWTQSQPELGTIPCDCVFRVHC